MLPSPTALPMAVKIKPDELKRSEDAGWLSKEGETLLFFHVINPAFFL